MTWGWLNRGEKCTPHRARHRRGGCARRTAGWSRACRLAQSSVRDVQIRGTVETQWTIPTTTHDAACEVVRKHGNGHDPVSYKSTGHAQMTIVDSGP